MDRTSRCIWHLDCSQKNNALFATASNTLVKVMTKTAALTLMTAGERRYGNLCFEICREVTRSGQVGRPPITLKARIKVRIKNKGSQTYKK